jgi:thiamine pyrophosphate-dependent acetolactate synthase large subunit-like protein
MVAQFQEENMDGRYIGTRDGYSNPNFSLISEAFGFDKYVLINSKDDLLRYISKAYEGPLGPELIEIRINEKAKALPKMQFKSPGMNLD